MSIESTSSAAAAAATTLPIPNPKASLPPQSSATVSVALQALSSKSEKAERPLLQKKSALASSTSNDDDDDDDCVFVKRSFVPPTAPPAPSEGTKSKKDLLAGFFTLCAFSASSRTSLFGKGIPNLVGTNCYVNSAIQALKNWPSLIEILKKEIPNSEPKANTVNAFRKRLLQIIEQLEKKDTPEAALSKKDIGAFLDFLIEQGWSSKEQKMDTQNVSDFLLFLIDHLGITQKSRNLKIGSSCEPIEFSELLFPADGNGDSGSTGSPSSKKRQSKFSLAENEKPDLLLFTVEGRLHEYKDKITRIIDPSFELEIPYKDQADKKENYELRAIIINPGSSSLAGHYATFIMQQVAGELKWVCYDDREVSVHAGRDEKAFEFVEQHSYAYLYSRRV